MARRTKAGHGPILDILPGARILKPSQNHTLDSKIRPLSGGSCVLRILQQLPRQTKVGFIKSMLYDLKNLNSGAGEKDRKTNLREGPWVTMPNMVVNGEESIVPRSCFNLLFGDRVAYPRKAVEI